MRKKKIAVIFGGCSNEYPISLQSAHAIISNIDPKIYRTVLIGITREGSWYHYLGEVDRILENTWHKENKDCIPIALLQDRKRPGIIEFRKGAIKYIKIDAAFPVLHGKNGEDGTVQGLIELTGMSLIGCNTLSSALCMDKGRAHRLVQAAGIRVPRSVVLSKLYDSALLQEATKELSYPLFVKPVKSGSSIGITMVSDKRDLYGAVRNAFSHDDEVIIEENIDGFEVGCAVLGNQELIIGEVDEIELTKVFFDYTEKYTLNSASIHMPARIDKETSDMVKETAAKIYKILGCKGLARVDMFLTPDMQIIFNEVNTMPGFTTHSRYPNMMKGIGLSFGELITKVIELGI